MSQEKQTRKIGKKSISSLYVLSGFKYFLIYNLGEKISKKLDKKTFELYQIFMC